MKTIAFALLACVLAAGCSQTGMEQDQVTATHAAARQTAYARPRCAEAIEASARAGQNAAIAGSVLSAAAGLGAFGGHGGAIAGQAAAVGGSVIQAQAQAAAQNTVHEECR